MDIDSSAHRMTTQAPLPAPQPGDTVRCLADMNPGDEFTAGKTYTVEWSNGVFVNVLKDDDGGLNGWGIENFVVVARHSAQQRVLQAEMS